MGWLSGFINWLFGYSDRSKTIAQIQAATVKMCGFLPYAETIAKLLSANPAVTAAAVVATQICKAVNAPKPMALMDVPPMIGDVVIEGEFVGKDK
jgi:hypothetical protein